MITMNTTKNTAMGRGRTRQAGCSVNIDAIQAALSPHRVRSMRSEPTAECLTEIVTTVRMASSTYGPTVTTESIRRSGPSTRVSGIGSLMCILLNQSTPSGTTGPRPARTPPRRRPW